MSHYASETLVAEIARLRQQLADKAVEVRTVWDIVRSERNANAELRARVDDLRAALRSFLHLTKRSADDAPGEDALSRLPDSHTFELTWGADGSGYPQITAGQIKRARALLKEPTNV